MTDQPDTKERILETALEVFAERGFEGASLRAITAEAGVNLAAVNYHFGSKEGLFGEVFGRLLGPVNEERLARLDRIEEAAGDGPLPLEPVVEAFLEPPLLVWGERGDLALRLLGRMYAEPVENVGKILHETFHEVASRFTQALHRALPNLEVDEVVWRLHFAVGAMAHTLAAHRFTKKVHPEMDAPLQGEAVVERLVPFVCAGFRAPAPGSRKRGRR